VESIADIIVHNRQGKLLSSTLRNMLPVVLTKMNQGTLGCQLGKVGQKGPFGAVNSRSSSFQIEASRLMSVSGTVPSDVVPGLCAAESSDVREDSDIAPKLPHRLSRPLLPLIGVQPLWPA
jgi:hypothetical protein